MSIPKQNTNILGADLERIQFLREALDGVSTHVYIKDLQSRYVYANRSTLELFGCSAGELVGKGDEHFFSPETVRQLREVDLRVFSGIRSEREINVSGKGQAVSGRVYWEVKTPLYTDPEHKTVIGLLGISTDITERKQAENVSQARLRLMEFAASHSMEEVLVATLDELEALTSSQIGFYHFVEPDEQTLNLQAWSTRTLRELCTAEGKGRHYDLDKAGVWVDCIRQRRTVIHNDYAALPHKKGLPPGHAAITRELVVPILRNGKIVAVLGVGNKPTDYVAGDVDVVSRFADLAWDIAERKYTEEKIHQSEHRFRALFEQAGLGAAEIDSVSGRFLSINQKYCDLVSYSREEMLRLTFADITVPEDLQAELDNMQRLLRGEISDFTMEKRYRRKSGEVIWVSLTVSPLWFSIGAPEGRTHLAIVQDITERKRAEQALRDSEDRLRFALETSHTGAWDLDLVDHTAFRSLEHDRIFGYTELLPKWTYEMFLEHVLPEDHAMVDEKFRRAIETRSDWSFECRIRRVDGAVRWIWAAGGHRTDATGAARRMAGIVQDITERKRTEEALAVANTDLRADRTAMLNMLDDQRRSEEEIQQLNSELEQRVQERTQELTTSERRLRMAQEAAKAGVWEWNLTTNANFWSEELWNLYGLEPYSCTPSYESWRQVIHPDDRSRAEQLVQAAVKQQAELNAEWRVRHPDGTERWLMSRGQPVRNASGQVVSYTGIVLDITERKDAEEALRRSEQLYRAIGESINYGVWVCNPDGRNIYASQSFLDLVGITQEQCSDFGWGQVLHPDDAERTIAAWKECCRVGGTWDIEHRFRGVDGNWHPVLARGVPVRDETGEIICWVGINLDISRLKQAEQSVKELNCILQLRAAELETANKELESFSYSVSHDLRAPLRAIDGFSRILMEEHAPQLSPEAQRYLNLARSNAQRMGRLIDDLLAFSRLSRQKLTKHKVDVNELVQHVLEDLSAEHRGRQVKITVNTLPDCEADSSLLRQVWMNLLSNAIKYTRKREAAVIEVGVMKPPGDGTAKPSSSEEPSSLAFACDGSPVYFVRDNGAGFDMKYADKLFGVFQRLHRAEEYEGTGVGLAIVQRIIHRHGGRVWAEGTPDRGATFYFTLNEEGIP